MYTDNFSIFFFLAGKNDKTEVFGLFVDGVLISLLKILLNYNMYHIFSNFEVSKYANLSYHPKNKRGMITHLIVHRNASQLTTLFIKEVLRIKNLNSVFYGLEKNKKRKKSFIVNRSRGHLEVTRDMIYLPPRRLMIDNFIGLYNRKQDKLEEKANDIYTAIYFMSKFYIAQPKVQINSRILVIGASTTGLAFINYLLSVSLSYFSIK